MCEQDCAIPESVVFTDGNMFALERGVYLHGFTSTGEHVCVQIRQSNVHDLDGAGCLFFDKALVPLRSKVEQQVLELLTNATFSEIPPGNANVSTDYIPGHIVAPEGLQRIRDEIVDYVSSDRYEDLVTNGIPEISAPWQPWNAAIPQSVAKEAVDEIKLRGAQHNVTATRAQKRKQPKQTPLSTWRRWVIGLACCFAVPWFGLRVFFTNEIAIGGFGSPDNSVIVVMHPQGYGLYIGRLPQPFSTWRFYKMNVVPLRELFDQVISHSGSDRLDLGVVSAHRKTPGFSSGQLLWIPPLTIMLAFFVAVGAYWLR